MLVGAIDGVGVEGEDRGEETRRRGLMRGRGSKGREVRGVNKERMDEGKWEWRSEEGSRR